MDLALNLSTVIKDFNSAKPNNPPTTSRIKIPEPKAFSGKGDDFMDFQNRYKRYIEYHQLEGSKSLGLLPFYLKNQAADFWDSLSPTDKIDLDTALDKLKERFCSTGFLMKTHLTHAQDSMQDEEDIDEYITRFHKRLRVLGLTEDRSQILMFIMGLPDKVREHCLMSPLDDLPKQLEIARAMYQASKSSRRPPT